MTLLEKVRRCCCHSKIPPRYARPPFAEGAFLVPPLFAEGAFLVPPFCKGGKGGFPNSIIDRRAIGFLFPARVLLYT